MSTSAFLFLLHRSHYHRLLLLLLLVFFYDCYQVKKKKKVIVQIGAGRASQTDQSTSIDPRRRDDKPHCGALFGCRSSLVRHDGQPKVSTRSKSDSRHLIFNKLKSWRLRTKHRLVLVYLQHASSSEKGEGPAFCCCFVVFQRHQYPSASHTYKKQPPSLLDIPQAAITRVG